MTVSRRRKWSRLLAVVVGLLLLGLVALWLRDEPAPVEPPPVAPSAVTLPVVAPPVAEPEAQRAPPSRTGRVVREHDRTPIAQAEVLVFDGPEPTAHLRCGKTPLLYCSDTDSIRRVLRGLKDGSLRRAPPVLVTKSGADGRYEFGLGDGAVLTKTSFLLARTASGFGYASEADETELEVIEAAAPRVHLEDESGRRLADLEVVVFSQDDGALRTVRSDAEGHLPLTARDATAWLGLEAPGFVPAATMMLEGDDVALRLVRPRSLRIKTVHDERPIDADVELRVGSFSRLVRTQQGVAEVDELGDLPLRLVATAGALTSQVRTLHGAYPPEVVLELGNNATLALTVLRAGAGPTRAAVQLHAPEEPRFTDLAFVGRSPVVLGPVAPGPWDVRVTAEGAQPLVRRVELVPGLNELTVTLAPGAEVSGVVLDAKGAPIDGAEIHVAGDGGVERPSTYSFRDGGFSLTAEPGPLALVAEFEGVSSEPVAVVAPASDLKLVLRARSGVEVELKSKDPGVVVTLGFVRRSEAEIAAGLHFEPGSRVAKAALPPGHYVAEVDVEGHARQSIAFDLAAGEVKHLVVELDGSPVISGDVTTRTGKAVPRATISALCGEALIDGVTGEDGRFALHGVHGVCSLMVSASKRPQAETKDLEVTAPARDVHITLEEAGTVVRGRALDEHGQPLAEVVVDDERIKTESGRFSSLATRETVSVTADRRERVELPVREELGDVVLRPLATCDGAVVSADGKPVGGASLALGEVGQAPIATITRTEDDGRFRLEPRVPGMRVVARSGRRSGWAMCREGSSARIVLSEPVTLSGVSFDGAGQPLSSLVIAWSVTDSSRKSVTANAAGRFSFDVSEGVWVVGQGYSLTRTVLVRGNTELTLGNAPNTCAAALAQPYYEGELLVMPAGATSPDAFAITPGALKMRVPSRAQTVTGLPCGDVVFMNFAGQVPARLVPPMTPVDLGY